MFASSYQDSRAEKLTAKASAEKRIRHELWKAKVALHEAWGEARDFEAAYGAPPCFPEFIGRVEEVFHTADRLFCDARSEEDKRKANIEALLDAEYGPASNTDLIQRHVDQLHRTLEHLNA